MSDTLPIGYIFFLDKEHAPRPGCLATNGAWVNVDQYDLLFDVLGATYGGKAGALHEYFKLPDYPGHQIKAFSFLEWPESLVHDRQLDLYRTSENFKDGIQTLADFVDRYLEQLEAKVTTPEQCTDALDAVRQADPGLKEDTGTWRYHY